MARTIGKETPPLTSGIRATFDTGNGKIQDSQVAICGNARSKDCESKMAKNRECVIDYGSILE